MSLFILQVLVLQGLIGITLVEWAFKKFERARNVVEERDSQFDSFRRLDVHLWTRMKFWPGAFFMIPRAVVLLSSWGIMGVCLNLLYVGKSFTVPLSGTRRQVFNLLIKAFNTFHICLFGYIPRHVQKTTDEVDYSKYLGPNYKKDEI